MADAVEATGYEKARPAVSATGPAQAEGKGEIESVEIRKLANETFVVRCNKKQSPGGPGYEPSKETAYPTLDAALDYAKSEFGGGEQPGEEATEPPGPEEPEAPSGGNRYGMTQGEPPGAGKPYLG